MSDTSLSRGPEWPTLALILASYLVWALVTLFAATLGLWLAVPILALTLTLHSSLQHEVTHGHPLPSRRLSEALVYAPLGLAVPYPRFRDLHIAHHRDATLTDPYDDPETNYLDPAVWARLPRGVRGVLLFNNTLVGRMLVGPAVGLAVFLRDDWRRIRAGDAAVRRAWALHAPGVAAVLAWTLAVSTMPLWAYLAAAYLALSILKIRTFLEHQAHERALGRSVIIEDRGPLAFLFLNNNLHAVHHAHPQVPWYALPALYAARREEWLRRNLGYRYAGYGEILRRHLLRRKDPVPHPLWPAA
jgi:fatty acid desaturase